MTALVCTASARSVTGLPAASVTPLATFTIWLPPLFRPSWVKLTFVVGSAGEPAIVMPVVSTTVSPTVTLPSGVRLMSWASFTFSEPVAGSATTPMLPSLSRAGSVTPPTTFSVLPRGRTTATPASSTNVSG